MRSELDERVAVVGSGAIACGLAVTASANGEVVLWARSDGSAERARRTVDKVCSKIEEGVDAGRVSVTTDLDALAGATIVVEAVVEDHDAQPGYAALGEQSAQAGRDPGRLVAQRQQHGHRFVDGVGPVGGPA